MKRRVLALSLAVLVAACGKQPEPAGAQMAAVAAVPAGADAGPVVPPTLDLSGNPHVAPGTFPEDGAQFFTDMKAVDLAIRTAVKGQFAALPIRRTGEGYPVFPLSCDEAKFGTVCSDEAQNVFEEDELLARLPLVRNSLIFDSNYRCDVLCLDQDGHPVGKLSEAAREWKLQHLLATAVVPASSPSREGEVLFFCKTRRGKQIELLALGDAVTYTFGKAGGAPEIALSVPRAKASTRQWDGTTRSMSYSVNIPNGKTVYSVFWSAERDPDSLDPVSAGVHVEIAGKHAATVECDPDTVVQALEDVDLSAA